MKAFRTRFAPSPTGLLHLGHAFSALTAFAAARAAGGEMLLRIEDIDGGRCRPEFESAIYEDLRWLGLEWPEPVRRQSDHFADYAAARERLIEIGVVYRCFKTRKQMLDEIASAPHLAPEGPEGPQFVGAPLAETEERRRVEAGDPFAWRLSIMRARELLGARYSALSFVTEEITAPHSKEIVAARPEIFGDVVIARKDVGTSYHLAAVHDDALQGVSHVIRGADLAAAAHLHVLLQALLGNPTPIYRHHRLITDGAGRRLAKRDKALTLRSQREAGATPEDVRRRLGFSD
jgi:glutamyl-Q tRNA(Asp) synthetase